MRPRFGAAGSPQETTRQRLFKTPGICIAPQFIAEELLRAEGSTKDIHWAVHPPAALIPLLADGTIDALVSFPPVPQELRARKIGQLLVSSAVDRL